MCVCGIVVFETIYILCVCVCVYSIQSVSLSESVNESVCKISKMMNRSSQDMCFFCGCKCELYMDIAYVTFHL